MKDGRIEQAGPPEQLYARPRNRFVAGFIGLANVLGGRLAGRSATELQVDLDNGAKLICAAQDELGQRQVGDWQSISIRPESIRIEPTAVNVSDERNMLTGIVSAAIFTGNLIDYFVRIDGIAEEIRVQTLPPVMARPGETVSLSVLPENCVPLED